MEQKETQQRHRGQMVISSLPPDRVPPNSQSATNPERMQPPENIKEYAMRVFVQMKQVMQLITRCTSLLLAIVTCLTTHRVMATLLLLGFASGTLSVREIKDTISLRLRSQPRRGKNHQTLATQDESHSVESQNPTEHHE